MAYLEIESTEGMRKVSLNRDRLSIGRLSYNDIMLASPQISRQHAELRRIDGQWWIADLNSTNGLHLNGNRIQEHLLVDGDEIALAPNIVARFVKEAADDLPADAASWPARSGVGRAPTSAELNPFSQSSPDWAALVAQQLHGQTDPQAQRNTHPIRYPPPTPPVAPTPASSSFAPLAPRSPFADDEELYVPPGLMPPPMMLPPNNTPAPAPIFTSPNTGPSSFVPGASFPAIASVSNPGNPGMSNMSNGSYPAPLGPMQSGADSQDPYHRSGPMTERSGMTGGTGGGQSSTLLHVCQTCGQLTAPDAVYCQNCHHSIAHECSNCRLSLLPIQDRCPRCHTPNEASVRRAHPGR